MQVARSSRCTPGTGRKTAGRSSWCRRGGRFGSWWDKIEPIQRLKPGFPMGPGFSLAAVQFLVRLNS